MSKMVYSMKSLKAKNCIPLHREIILETISQIEEYILHTDNKSEKTTNKEKIVQPILIALLVKPD